MKQPEPITGLEFHAAILADIAVHGFDHVISINPEPTKRPRSRAIKKGNGAIATTYNDPKYTKYKETLTYLIKACKSLTPGDYRFIYATFYMTYPKSTPKYKLVEGTYHEKKPDWDNYVKALQDALEQAGIIENDSQISTGFVEKRYTTQDKGRIEFSLIK